MHPHLSYALAVERQAELRREAERWRRARGDGGRRGGRRLRDLALLMARAGRTARRADVPATDVSGAVRSASDLPATGRNPRRPAARTSTTEGREAA